MEMAPGMGDKVMAKGNLCASALSIALSMVLPRVCSPSEAPTHVPLPASAGEKLNVVLFLIDDLGATDLGCTGSKFYQTPNIDRLAQEGMRFTTSYASCPVCSPTRSSILTGKYPARLHITDWIPGEGRKTEKLLSPDWRMYLPLTERTIANNFRDAGYATASIGKWHLGGPKYYPEHHGFDINIAGTDKGQPPSYFSPYHISTLKDGPVGEFLTDRESAEAVKFIDTNQNRPFFLYLPHHAVHTPLMGKQDVVAKYRARRTADDPQNNATYASLVESVDDSVGKIVGELERLKLIDKTVIVFTSDNGGLLGSTYNIGMRAGKGSPYEGGVRVPLIVRWPGVTQPATTSAIPTISMDLYPTLLNAFGGAPAKGQIFDGVDLMPALKGGVLASRPIYWHYPHYHLGGATPYSAVRDGDYRLLEFFEDHRVELYNLKTDPLESHDIAISEPALVAKLYRQLAAWRKKVGAQLPTINPGHDPNADPEVLVDLD